MHLTEAMVDFETGNPIVAGEIVLELGKQSPISMPAHAHLLLAFTDGTPRTMTCRAVTQLKRLENGFYAVATAAPWIEMEPLGRDTFGWISGAGAESRTAFRGPSCGAFWQETGKPLVIAGLEMIRQLQSGGMEFRITGAFDTASMADASKSPSSVAGFEIRGLTPWETLKLFGFGAGGYRSDFISEPQECVRERIDSFAGLDPFTLADLRPAEFDREWLAAGHAQLGRSPARPVNPVNRIVNVNWGASGLFLQACDHVLRDADGFCRAAGRGGIYFRSIPITRECIEQLLRERQRSRAVLSLTGDGIGSVTYETGAMLEPGLNEIVVLDAERLDLEATLSRAGLHLDMAATLKKTGRVARSISEFVPHHQSQGTHFSATAILPWSLLLVRGSRLAERRGAFSD